MGKCFWVNLLRYYKLYEMMGGTFFFQRLEPPFPYLRVSSYVYCKLLFKKLPLALLSISSSMIFFLNGKFGGEWISRKTFIFTDLSCLSVAAVAMGPKEGKQFQKALQFYLINKIIWRLKVQKIECMSYLNQQISSCYRYLV